MIPKNEATEKERFAFKVITFSMLLFSPIVYIVVAYLVTHPSGEPVAIRGAGEVTLAFNILLIVSFAFPFVYPLLEKFQISMNKKNVVKNIKSTDNFDVKNNSELPSLFGSKGVSGMFGTGPGKPIKISSLYKSVSIIKFSLVGVSYFLGLAMVFVTMDINYLIYFYPIGIIWSIIYWPKESKYFEFKRKLEII